MKEGTKTRAGLVPVQSELPFEITTANAEAYLQHKMDAVVSLMRSRGSNQPDVNVIMFTSECSRKFFPFMVLLPLTVLQGNNKKHRDEDELDIFNPDSSEENAKVVLKNEIYTLLAAYAYNKYDGQAFFSPEWRRQLGVSQTTAANLKSMRTPKIMKFNKGKNEFVTLFIDPVRLFHDMLRDPENDKESFKISITGTEKIKGAEYKYRVLKQSNKMTRDNESWEDRLAKEINSKLRG